MKRRHCSLLLAAALFEDLPAMTQHHANVDYTELPTSLSFAQTLDRIGAAIEAAGMRVFARIDHAAAATGVGLAMPPTTVLIYGSPKGGTPLMLASPAAALDLPLRVLVREDADGHAFVSFHPVIAMLTKAGVPMSLAERLVPAQGVLIRAIQS
jgi:uncharacterized protein (DUF302 family)